MKVNEWSNIKTILLGPYKGLYQKKFNIFVSSFEKMENTNSRNLIHTFIKKNKFLKNNFFIKYFKSMQPV